MSLSIHKLKMVGKHNESKKNINYVLFSKESQSIIGSPRSAPTPQICTMQKACAPAATKRTVNQKLLFPIAIEVKPGASGSL